MREPLSDLDSETSLLACKGCEMSGAVPGEYTDESAPSRKRNLIFLGCNYSNKKVKKHFENLKKTLESRFPVSVVLIDKEKAKGARDLWMEIKESITESALAIFDVSAFRPNVVLELGYALAEGDYEKVLITFDERQPRGGKKPEWMLSDISHLNRIPYKTLGQMDQKIEENLSKVPSVASYRSLCGEAQKCTTAPDKYSQAALTVLKVLRDHGPLTDTQVDDLCKGTSVRRDTLKRLLRDHRLADTRPDDGQWSLVCE